MAACARGARGLLGGVCRTLRAFAVAGVTLWRVTLRGRFVWWGANAWGGMVVLDVAVFARGGLVLCCTWLSQQEQTRVAACARGARGLLGGVCRTLRAFAVAGVTLWRVTFRGRFVRCGANGCRRVA